MNNSDYYINNINVKEPEEQKTEDISFLFKLERTVLAAYILGGVWGAIQYYLLG